MFGPSGKIARRGSELFARQATAAIQRSVFDRSFAYKTTFDAGFLIPIYVDEALPGDTFTMKMQGFARLATPLKPIMDNLHLETFFFAVPNRLLWENWQKFMGEQLNPADSIDYMLPQVQGGIGDMGNVGDIYDYMGIPPGGTSYSVSALPLRAYNLIYNEWFRDQNLQDSVTVNVDDGPDTYTDYVVLRRGKRADYFTTALPWPQKALNATTSVGAPVVSTESAIWLQDQGIGQNRRVTGAAPLALHVDGSAMSGTPTMFFTPEDEVSGATGLQVLVNQMREAFQVQKLLERDARGGTRYTELIRAHFGVTSPDARLQRPEYLGGGYAPIVVNPIAQTSPQIAGGTPQANLAAMGTGSFAGHGFHKSFTEHCTLIGLMCVRADYTYQFGIERMWQRSTRYDFYWPELAHLGEQTIDSTEIANNAGFPSVFGYQERYAEYRYKNSLVTGLFRSNPSTGTSLDIWHLAQDYGAGLPALNADFIVENPPVDRVIAVPGEPHFLFDSWTQLKCARPMPVFGTPGMVDHF